MTLAKERKNPMLVMVMLTRLIDFKYRIFFVRGSKRKTYHQAGDSKVSRYDEIWRLAPRRELIIKQDPSTIYVGQTLRFTYGISDAFITVLVTRATTKTLEGTIECGSNAGQKESYNREEILDCHDVFGSSLLHGLLREVKEYSWSSAEKSVTPSSPSRQPKLNLDFRVGADIKTKRKWHILKILGKSVNLLCERTNMRAKRRLSSCSSLPYKNR